MWNNRPYIGRNGSKTLKILTCITRGDRKLSFIVWKTTRNTLTLCNSRQNLTLYTTKVPNTTVPETKGTICLPIPKKGNGTAISDDLNMLDSFETATNHHLNPHLESIMVMAYGLATKEDKVAHEPKIITGIKGQK